MIHTTVHLKFNQSCGIGAKITNQVDLTLERVVIDSRDSENRREFE